MSSSLAQKLVRLADLFGGGNSGYGIPLANRNYIIDPNMDQLITNSVTLSGGGTTRGLTPMYLLSPGAGGGATCFYGQPGSVAGDQPGMASPLGGALSITPNGASTGTLVARSQPCIIQNIEFVQTLQGRSSTFSLWLWTGSGTVTINNIAAAQIFGTGGSPSANVIIDTPVNWVVTTTPQRFSVRVDWPSTIGKTLGSANDYIQIGIFIPSNTTINIGTRQWQLEQSSPQAPAAGLPTAFEYRGYGPELARTQRYYRSGFACFIGSAAAAGVTVGGWVPFPVDMRVPPVITMATANENANNASVAYTLVLTSGFRFYGTATAAGSSYYDGPYTADARL